MDKIMYLTYGQMSQTLSTVLAIIAILVVLTNIIAQVAKHVIGTERVPAQVIVAVVAIVLTVAAMVVVLSWMAQPVYWYYWIAAVLVGILVAYGAMFGYDNLYYQIVEVFKKTDEAAQSVTKKEEK